MIIWYMDGQSDNDNHSDQLNDNNAEYEHSRED